ncbi:MAG: hypothetical protein JNG85_11845 [Spirochaetaceae bacterium]|nr:hypothetical protein [Spirochaetaceae bacterium]
MSGRPDPANVVAVNTWLMDRIEALESAAAAAAPYASTYERPLTLRELAEKKDMSIKRIRHLLAIGCPYVPIGGSFFVVESRFDAFVASLETRKSKARKPGEAA